MEGDIYEWTYSGSGWTYESIGPSTGYIPGIIVGKGRNDNLNRIYAVNRYDTDICEFSYSSGTRTQEYLDTTGWWIGITIGDARNDDTLRIYAGGGQIGTSEHTWNGTSWERVIVETTSTGVWPLDVGNGRNDGINRLYCPERYYPYVREYTWNGSSYDEAVINLPNPICMVVVGDGRGDGVNRVYASCDYDHIYELTYSGGTRQQVDICPTAPLHGRYGLCLGRTRSDGQIRVYSVAQQGAIREHARDGSVWVDSVDDAVTGATTSLTVGNRRNDDTSRIYVTSAQDGSIYEFTNDSPWIGVETTPSLFSKYKLEQNKPNLFISFAEICFRLNKACVPAKLRIYDLTGKLIATLAEKNRQGVYRTKWDAQDANGNKLPPGLYFYKLEGKSFSVSKKLILL